MLTRWYRTGSSRRSLNNIPRVPKARRPLLRREFMVFLRSSCNFTPTVHGFVRAVIFLHALTIVCVSFFFFISLHNLRNVLFVPSGHDALQWDDLGLLGCGVLLDLLSWSASANRTSEL